MQVRRLIDLSHSVDAGTTVYPGDPEVRLSDAATIADDGFNVLHVHMGSQTGTHVDAPYHFLAEGARIDELELGHFVAPAVVADLRGVGARAAITWESLQPLSDRLRPDAMVLLHTGWDEHWGRETYFDHPYLTADAAERLVALGVRTVGIDALSIDRTVLEGEHPTGFATHHVLLGAGGVIVENLTNLAALGQAEVLVSVLPIRLTGADGAPVRAVAMEFDVGDH
jgi:kynurenine formamidase